MMDKKHLLMNISESYPRIKLTMFLCGKKIKGFNLKF